MGTWGVGPLENDHVADLQDEIRDDRGIQALFDCLDTLSATQDDHLDSDSLDYVRAVPYLIRSEKKLNNAIAEVQILSKYANTLLRPFLTVATKDYFFLWENPLKFGEQLLKDWDLFLAYCPEFECYRSEVVTQIQSNYLMGKS